MDRPHSTSIKEGVGIVPDIWAHTEFDVFKNIWNITQDYDIKINFGAFGVADFLIILNLKDFIDKGLS